LKPTAIRATRYRTVPGASILLLLAALASASADEFHTPQTSSLRVDWRAALEQLRTEINAQPSIATSFSFTGRRRLPSYDPRRLPAMVQLNALTSPYFAGIARGGVPVLLPFDTAGYLDARQAGAPATLSLSRYQAGFRPAEMFDAGPAGYDALFGLEPGAGDAMPVRTFVKPVEVQITGSNLIYDIADPLADKGEPVKALAAQFPDLRRFIREGYVRYAFTKFGVPYVVSIQCLDSTPRPKRLACREAYPVAERFLKALRVAGGLPARPRIDLAPAVAERPQQLSPDFSYRASGDIIANSGYRKQPGRPDLTVYSQIRFPLEKPPAFAHSQSYKLRRASGKAADDGNAYSYPWQDNFCESRNFGVGQCASGFGHQGQDIRPGACLPGNAGCDPKQQSVVAVRDGVLIRSEKQQAATLQVNSRTEHIRFRYMHMSPSAMDADGVLNGRIVGEGEKIGVVSNYLDHPNGTTRHLHFDVQVFTRDGWLWVNPYVTLISAYERLIGARGREFLPKPPEPIVPETAAVAHAVPVEPPAPIDPGEGSEN
jgi:murein DD-endopeptidase MepM/ murein hydrolase activator NlpD